MTLQAQLAAGIAALGLALPADAEAKLLAYLALLDKWNRVYNLTAVRDTERIVNASLKPQGDGIRRRSAEEGGRDVTRLEEELSDLLASSVKIKVGRKGAGQLTIEFGSLDALDGILARIRAE